MEKAIKEMKNAGHEGVKTEMVKIMREEKT